MNISYEPFSSNTRIVPSPIFIEKDEKTVNIEILAPLKDKVSGCLTRSQCRNAGKISTYNAILDQDLNKIIEEKPTEKVNPIPVIDSPEVKILEDYANIIKLPKDFRIKDYLSKKRESDYENVLELYLSKKMKF